MNPATILTRDELAQALTRSGYPTAIKTLQVYASLQNGPPYTLERKDGRGAWRAVYHWGTALAWAKARAISLGRESPDQAA